MSKQKIMKRAHELARKMNGHYVARLTIALRQAWKEAKGMKVADKKFCVKAWFAEKNGLFVSKEQRAQGIVELRGYIKKETEKAFLIEAYQPTKRTETKGPMEIDWRIEGWFPKKVLEVYDI